MVTIKKRRQTWENLGKGLEWGHQHSSGKARKETDSLKKAFSLQRPRKYRKT